MNGLTLYRSIVWPLVGRIVSKPARCSRCILSEECVELIDGLCRHCHGFEQLPEAGSPHTLEDLDACIAEVCRGGNGVYHATLLISGGKDSGYLLWKLRRRYPDLRLLCVYVDNGYASPFAIRNARLAVEKLGVDLLVVRSRIEDFRVSIRNAFRDLHGAGCYGAIDYIDGSMIFQTGTNVSQAAGIPCMISGLSWVQLERIVGTTAFTERLDGLQQLYPLAVFREDEQEIRRVVREQGLVVRGSDDPVVSNSKLIPAMLAIDIKNLGYSSFELEFAQLIREGKSDRDAWLPLFEMSKYLVDSGRLDSELASTLAYFTLKIEDVLR